MAVSLNTEQVNVLVLAKEALNVGLIHQRVVDDIASLHPQVPNSVKHRYLLMHVHESIKNDEELFMKMVNVFVKHGSHVPRNDCISAVAEVNPAANTDDTVFDLGPRHIPDLVEFLAEYAHKWRSIGTALRFKPQDLDNIQATPGLFATAPASFLTKLFEDWVQKRLYYTLPPTVGAIETALRSRTVELGLEADEIENYMQSSPSSKDKPTTDTMPVMSGRSFVCFSLIFDDTTEGNVEVHCTTNIRKNLNVGENRSVLLEVNSNIKGLILGYQWLANRKVLHDNKNFSGCESSIMCITKADLTMDGVQISCEVKAKCLEHTVKTSSVTLKVDSKLDNYFGILARLYLLRPEVPEDVWPPVSSKKFINLALIKH